MPFVPMGDAMTLQAQRDPDRMAVICEDRTITRGELDRRANRMARALAERGVRKDALVALIVPNSIEWYVYVLALWKLGAMPLPLSARMPDAELEPILELADPALVVGLEAGRLGVRCPVLPVDFEPDAAIDDSPFPSEVATYYRALTSGGSTGRPKIIVAHQPSMCDPESPPLKMQVDGVQLVPGPLYHNGPFTFSTMGLLSGSMLIVMTKFDASKALELIERHRVDWVQLVPTMSHRIWRLPDAEREARDISSLRLVFSTAGAFPPALKQAWLDWIGPDRLLEIYGGTEQFGATQVTGEEALRKPGTVGRPAQGVVRILDEDGNDLPSSEVGEVYFKQPEKPTYHYIGAEPKVRDGWETLGDLGYVDDEGYLFLADRRTDMIVSGGQNIFPAEVEAAIASHPSVRDAVVVGLPDDDLGARAHAIVDIGRDDGPPHEVTAQDLLDHLGMRLVRYKIPRSIELVTEPMRSDAGKVRRAQLREERL